jgi:hypothetical protein
MSHGPTVREKLQSCCCGCQVWNIVSGRSMTTFKIYRHSRLVIFTSFQGSLNEYMYVYISSKVRRNFPHFWPDSNQIRIDRWPDITMVIEISNLITATNLQSCKRGYPSLKKRANKTINWRAIWQQRTICAWQTFHSNMFYIEICFISTAYHT